MTKLTDEQIQAILKDALDWQRCHCTETENRYPYDKYHNLSDLREILELRQEVERQEVERLKLEQREVAALAFHDATIPNKAKAGCIGEFGFIVESANCCPECWRKKNDDCELCGGESDENGISDLKVQVPWDLQKKIWLHMNKIYANQLKEQNND